MKCCSYENVEGGKNTRGVGGWGGERREGESGNGVYLGVQKEG